MKRFHRLFLVLFGAFWAVACDSPPGKPGNPHGRPDSVAGTGAGLRPDTFNSAPANIEGCVGLYTYDSLNIPFDSLDVDKGKKILATKTESFAFFRLRGRNIILRYDSAQSGKLGDKEFREVYRGNDFKIILTLRTQEQEGESVKESGTFEIIQGDRHFTVKVKGLSGC